MTLLVFVHGLEIDAEIGVRLDERGRRQTLLVDIDVTSQEPAADDLVAAVDYRALAETATESVSGRHIGLIETAAARIADACAAMVGVVGVAVTVRKPAALTPALAGVRVVRGEV